MPQCHFTRQLTRPTLVEIEAKRRPCNVIFIGTQIARATPVITCDLEFFVADTE